MVVRGTAAPWSHSQKESSPLCAPWSPLSSHPSQCSSPSSSRHLEAAPAGAIKCLQGPRISTDSMAAFSSHSKLGRTCGVLCPIHFYQNLYFNLDLNWKHSIHFFAAWKVNTELFPFTKDEWSSHSGIFLFPFVLRALNHTTRSSIASWSWRQHWRCLWGAQF